MVFIKWRNFNRRKSSIGICRNSAKFLLGHVCGGLTIRICKLSLYHELGTDFRVGFIWQDSGMYFQNNSSATWTIQVVPMRSIGMWKESAVSYEGKAFSFITGKQEVRPSW